jgi:hypothetical protein
MLFSPWIRNEFFPDPGSRIPDPFAYDLDYDLAPESIRSKKKVTLHSTFHVGSGIKHPGSATLVGFFFAV